MTPQDFIAKWGPGGPAYGLNERQGAQPHFMDLCELLGVPTPGSAGDYIFEQDTLVLGEARGYADVFKRDHFAWENKAPGKNLDAALKQLLTYSLALANPPLLVVCDRLTIRIHTQFNGHPSETHTVLLAELGQPEKLALLRRIWLDPESFRPHKTSRDITEAAAKSFATLADGLRRRGQDTDEVAHFLTQCLFCFFAEDVGLLPGRMFEGLVNNRALTSDKLSQGLKNLFTVMRDGGLYGNDDIPWFNGGLFKKIKVPSLTILDMTELRNAAALNWSAIDVSIFGTLFERGLDPSKRSQLGAHYTDPATIMRIVEPVLSRPLLQKWELVAKEVQGLTAKSTKKNDRNHKAAQARFVLWLEELKNYRVLDPACGSGNFLFLGLKALKDIEHKSHLDAAAMGLDREADLVTGPHNVLGIELNEYAAELARVTVWIGELQWRMAHGYEFKTNPVLEPLDHIECRDALLANWGSDSDFTKGSSGADSQFAHSVGSSQAQAGRTPGAPRPSD
ncbi:MAG: DNA methyltransferase, partial [Rhodoferax sp.]